MSGKAVKSAIDALDGTVSGSAGSGKTLTAFSQTDGKVSATFGNISITKSQISDFPTIPTVNNATLTIQKNGTTVKTFTANASSNVTANITMSKSDVGLGNVDNTADADKIVSGAKKVFWSSDPNGSGAYVSGYAAGRNQVENNNDTIPTGAAVVSYLNTNYTTIGSTVKLFKIGRIVVISVTGLAVKNYASATELISSANAKYRPLENISFLGLSYIGESNNYVATMDVQSDGKVIIRNKTAVNSRAVDSVNSYTFYGTGCWIANT